MHKQIKEALFNKKIRKKKKVELEKACFKKTIGSC